MSVKAVATEAGSTVQQEDPAKTKFPKLNERLTEELVIALVGPVGSGCSKSYELLKETLEKDYEYTVHYYKLSDIIIESAPIIGERIDAGINEADRVHKLQTVGDHLRRKLGKSYLPAKAIEKIAKWRDSEAVGKTADGQAVPITRRHVHIIDSIKHPDELKLLRSTYGDIFWLIGVFAPMKIRERRLEFQQHLDKKQIAAIVQRDYTEDADHGQKVRDVFYQADFFVRNDHENTTGLKRILERFVEILFGVPVHTPTQDEFSMYAAYAEATKSACLSRQVGAAIVSNTGELIGLGRNDVPKFNGGLYSEDDRDNDHRCYAWQGCQCHNDKKKDGLYEQIFARLQAANLLSDKTAFGDVLTELKATDVKALIEYSRAVHAEMDAIISVARTHKAGILGGTLYSTTFPCHSCARHIVASGINRVVFIEPYPKSLAIELHSDAVSEQEGDHGKKVLFLQYSGIAPKNILKLFSMGSSRKEKDGVLKKIDKKTAFPVVGVSLDDYATHESGSSRS